MQWALYKDVLVGVPELFNYNTKTSLRIYCFFFILDLWSWHLTGLRRGQEETGDGRAGQAEDDSRASERIAPRIPQETRSGQTGGAGGGHHGR